MMNNFEGAYPEDESRSTFTLAEMEQFDIDHPEHAEHPEILIGEVGTCIAGFPESMEAAYQHVYGSPTTDGCASCQEAVGNKLQLIEYYKTAR